MSRKRTPEQNRLLAIVSTIEARAQVFERETDAALARCRRELMVGVGASVSGGVLVGALLGAILGRRRG
jgi:hypothetical protein